MRLRRASNVREQWEIVRPFANTMNAVCRRKPPWPSKEAARGYGAWRAAEAVLLPSLPHIDPNSLAHRTVVRFNRLARANGAAPCITEYRAPGRRVTAPSFVFRDEFVGYVVGRLWQLFVTSACKRLKHCATCKKWFADRTKNNAAKWCSLRCRDRAWNRDRRRAAGHTQYRGSSARRRTTKRRRPVVPRASNRPRSS
jgi:hypothetical protein